MQVQHARERGDHTASFFCKELCNWREGVSNGYNICHSRIHFAIFESMQHSLAESLKNQISTCICSTIAYIVIECLPPPPITCHEAISTLNEYIKALSKTCAPDYSFDTFSHSLTFSE